MLENTKLYTLLFQDGNLYNNGVHKSIEWSIDCLKKVRRIYVR